MRADKSIFRIRFCVSTLLTVCVLFLCAGVSLSADLTLAWDANSESDIEGYKIYYLTAAPDGWIDGTGLDQGRSPITVRIGALKTAAAPSFQLSNLNAGESYHFAVTAYNTKGNESDYSNMVRYDVPEATTSDIPEAISSGISGPLTHPLTATTSGRGEISPAGTVIVPEGSGKTFVITADRNHHIEDVIVDGKSVGPVASHTFSEVGGQHTIHAVFKIDTFMIAASVDGNGTISPDGTSEAAFGSDLRCTVSPHAGYRIADVKVDGISVGAAAQYTFSNITKDHVIEACFEQMIAGFFMEAGEVTADHNWKKVSFGRTYEKPVVVASPLSFNDDEPAVVRIDSVTATGFEISVQEWDYLDSDHLEETIGYIVMEAGSFTLPDGTRVEAGICEESDAFGVNRLIFDSEFRQKPVVAASVVSYNNPNAVTTRLKEISAAGFGFQIQEEEANQPYQNYDTFYNIYNLYRYYGFYNGFNNRIDFPLSTPPAPSPQETISYIAWEPCRTELYGMTIEVGKTEEIMDHNFSTIAFENPFDAAPFFLAAMQTTNAIDTASLRWDELSNSGFQVKVEEEESFDREVSHTAEVIGYFAVVPDSTLPTD